MAKKSRPRSRASKSRSRRQKSASKSRSRRRSSPRSKYRASSLYRVFYGNNGNKFVVEYSGGTWNIINSDPSLDYDISDFLTSKIIKVKNKKSAEWVEYKADWKPIDTVDTLPDTKRPESSDPERGGTLVSESQIFPTNEKTATSRDLTKLFSEDGTKEIGGGGDVIGYDDDVIGSIDEINKFDEARRIEQDERIINEIQEDNIDIDSPELLIGRYVQSEAGPLGIVISFEKNDGEYNYHVVYEDKKEKDMDAEELRLLLVPAGAVPKYKRQELREAQVVHPKHYIQNIYNVCMLNKQFSAQPFFPPEFIRKAKKLFTSNYDLNLNFNTMLGRNLKTMIGDDKLTRRRIFDVLSRAQEQLSRKRSQAGSQAPAPKRPHR